MHIDPSSPPGSNSDPINPNENGSKLDPAPSQTYIGVVSPDQLPTGILVQTFDALRMQLLIRARLLQVDQLELLILFELLVRCDENVYRITGKLEFHMMLVELMRVVGIKGVSTYYDRIASLENKKLIVKTKGRRHGEFLFEVTCPFVLDDQTQLIEELKHRIAELEAQQSEANNEFRPDGIGEEAFVESAGATDAGSGSTESNFLDGDRFRQDGIPAGRARQDGIPAGRARQDGIGEDDVGVTCEIEPENAITKGNGICSSTSSTTSSPTTVEAGKESSKEKSADELLELPGIGQPTRGKLTRLATTTPDLIRAATIEAAGKGVGLLVSCIRNPDWITEKSWQQSREGVASASPVAPPPSKDEALRQRIEAAGRRL